jgi:polysaccharide deacetylase family protein (PEP-CTERM system associated)
MYSVFSVDVEEWFNLLESNSILSFENWDKYPTRIDIILPRILDLLETNNARATFFFLGWIAERYPNLVQLVSNKGHEVAIHGYYHELIYNQSYEEFYNDVSKTKNILENITGKKVIGYRAPGFSITKKTLWAYKTLIDLDIKYSSSVFPANRAHGTFKEFELSPTIINYKKKTIIEFPQTILKFLFIRFSCFGGGYFRIFPLEFYLYCSKFILKQNRPNIFYIHPRDIDAFQPRLPLPLLRRFKAYINISKTENKLLRILESQDYTSFKNIYKNLKSEELQHTTLYIPNGYHSAYLSDFTQNRISE